MTLPLSPPFTRETALKKVRAAEDAWNTRIPFVSRWRIRLSRFWRTAIGS